MSTPKRLAVMQRLTEAVRAIPGVRGCEYDAPIDDAPTKLPAAYVYDISEDSEISECHGRYRLTVGVDVVFLYEYGARPSQGKHTIGNELLAQLKLAIARDRTLGDMVFMLRPTASVIQEFPIDDRRTLAAITVGVEVQYEENMTNPYDLAA